jgi:hypothetical protein
MISARVAFHPGIFTPFIARDATSIISLNFGCSSAWIGLILKFGIRRVQLYVSKRT